MRLDKFIAIIFCVFFSLDSFSQENKEEKSVSFMVIEKVPIYPGCKGNSKELKACFSMSIQKLFIDNFNMDLANNIGLAGGKYRVFIGFKISNKGNIENVLVRAPHDKIEDEVRRVMYLIPKMIPGEVKGKKVGVKYSIPFTMNVEETKEQKRKRKKQ